MTLALDEDSQHLLRDMAPQVLGILLRRYRDFAGCEDAVQEALIAAATQWPKDGVPDNPRGWLIRVATRRLTDQVRADTARRLREQLVVSLIPADEQIALAADAGAGTERDESLDLYFMLPSVADTLVADRADAARHWRLDDNRDRARVPVPDATMAQRLSRAKQTIRDSGTGFSAPTSADRSARLPAVLHVLYLIFSEGYAASSGRDLRRIDLSSEAIRVVRMIEALLPEEAEVNGLLALMLLTDARRAARTGPSGELVPLDEQDRGRWDGAAVAEGVARLDQALSRGAVGPYQIQAAIAALHDEAASTETTDWPQVLALYDLLLRMSDNPMTRLSRAVALAMVDGPEAGLAALATLSRDPRITQHHRLDAVRGHLHERSGDREAAIIHYRRAADDTASTPERNYLLLRAARIAEA